jgi:6-pyruvoyltetrahydropterin/6-carboxytetrahydropterin synthase
MRVTLTRRYALPALHVLKGEGFTAEENRRVFGGCSSLHGHEYLVEVAVSGPIDPHSGLIASRDELDGLIRRRLLDPLVGSNLSDHFPRTTGEELAAQFFDLLEGEIGPPLRLKRVTVRETAKNSFVYEGHYFV